MAGTQLLQQEQAAEEIGQVDPLPACTCQHALPLGLISQFMPVQFERLSMNEIVATPQNLIIDKIQDVLRAYRFGCTPEHV
jgi:D-tagatose-1,6-bisphosphate aldolase subunit GatZ/KbaZ